MDLRKGSFCHTINCYLVLKMLRDLISKNLSLIVMLFGAGIVFLSTIGAKQFLSEHDFYHWTLFLTLITVVSPCCLLGGEQLFIRYGTTNLHSYEVQLEVMLIIVFLCLVGTISSFYIFSSMMKVDLSLEASLLTFLFSFISILYSLFRVTSHFFLAQTINNLWKIILLPLMFFFGFFDYYNIPHLFLVAIGISVLISLYLYKRHPIKIKLVRRSICEVDLFYLAIGFSLTLITVTLLSNFDRFLMERYTTLSIFSEYVYLLMVLIFPFNILSSYIGFKEVAFVKNNYNKEHFIKRMFGYSTALTSLFIIWYFVIYLFREFIQIELNYNVFFICVALVFVKSAYSMCSAAFGIKGKPRQIILANVQSLLILGLSLFYLFINKTEITVNLALSLTMFIFVTRYFIFLIFTLKGSNDV